MNKDLQRIKKMYGEAMMHLCRSLFPIILETEGLLPKILESTFAPSRALYEDAKEYEEIFKSIIYEKFHENKKEEKKEIEKTPQELMSMVGYDLYECHTEEEIQAFKKYYASGEELCTFRGGRLQTNYVYFAVKKDVDKIKREDFLRPEREDLYGTSVMSIQFTRTEDCILSIKNRYNHRVVNPDATYSNNLDNIIEGLTKSFEKYEGKVQRIKPDAEMPGYIQANDGKYYKYNLERYNVYYCPDNVIIDEYRNVKKYPKEQYIIFDYFIFDLKNKKIECYDKTIRDSFLNMFNIIEHISIEKDGNIKKLKIKTDKGPVEIHLNEKNESVYLENNWLEEIEKYFLNYNESLKGINLSMAKIIGDNFLNYNLMLESINIPNAEKIGNDFLFRNQKLKSINIPKVARIGDFFLSSNIELESINIDSVEEIERDFLYRNRNLKSINLPKVKKIKSSFLESNQVLESINIPEVEEIGINFLNWNDSLKNINMPKVKKIGASFLEDDTVLEYINIPEVEEIGEHFLHSDRKLTSINLPKVTKIAHTFLYNNEILESINIPNIQEIGDNFLYYNRSLKNLNIPNAIRLGNRFLYSNMILETINVDNVKEIKSEFLAQNDSLTSINMPNIVSVGYDFLYNNEVIEKIIINENLDEKSIDNLGHSDALITDSYKI